MDSFTSRSTETHHILKFSVLPLSALLPLTVCSEYPFTGLWFLIYISLCLSVSCSASLHFPLNLTFLSPLCSPGLHFYFFFIGHNMKIYEKHLLKCCDFLPLNKIREAKSSVHIFQKELNQIIFVSGGHWLSVAHQHPSRQAPRKTDSPLLRSLALWYISRHW